jgi:hypothetical protein
MPKDFPPTAAAGSLLAKDMGVGASGAAFAIERADDKGRACGDTKPSLEPLRRNTGIIASPPR